MRHLARTHKVDLGYLHERFMAEDFAIHITNTDKQSADIFTKAFCNADK